MFYKIERKKFKFFNFIYFGSIEWPSSDGKNSCAFEYNLGLDYIQINNCIFSRSEESFYRPEKNL